ncbi:MAG: hypothetical protein R3A79_03490 [Nannocystaceae bacterium]
MVFGVGLFPLLEPLLVGVEPLGWGMRLLLVLGVAPVAPITTLLLATFAANKVQGLAFTKFGGVAGLTILIGWFVPLPWQWALGVFPPFLIAKAYWLALAGDLLWIAAYALGVLLELLALSWLLRRFRENAAR